jgi:iron complex transport system ATP-binding protein
VKLSLDRVVVRRGARLLLDNVSLELGDSDFIALVGPNGAGKSTLLRTALGVIPSATGATTLGDAPVGALRGRDRAARASWLPQRPSFHEPIQVLDFVCAARFRFNETLAVARLSARACLARMGADSFESRDLATLSGGEQQRVALAALLAQDAPLLLLDEPGAHLDPRQQLEVHSLLTALWREGRGLLCATHDLNLLAHALGPSEASRVRVVGLRDGKIRFSCAYDATELGVHLSDLFDVEMRAVTESGRRFFFGQPRAS